MNQSLTQKRARRVGMEATIDKRICRSRTLKISHLRLKLKGHASGHFPVDYFFLFLLASLPNSKSNPSANVPRQPM